MLHATTVALAGQGVLILGPSGSGKSGLALQLMAMGAELVADDRTIVTARGSTLHARAPGTIAGRIEARGVGILQVAARAEVDLALAVDMGRVEAQRLPEPHAVAVLGLSLPCLHKVEMPHFPAAILHYLRSEPPRGAPETKGPT